MDVPYDVWEKIVHLGYNSGILSRKDLDEIKEVNETFNTIYWSTLKKYLTITHENNMLLVIENSKRLMYAADLMELAKECSVKKAKLILYDKTQNKNINLTTGKTTYSEPKQRTNYENKQPIYTTMTVLRLETLGRWIILIRKDNPTKYDKDKFKIYVKCDDGSEYIEDCLSGDPFANLKHNREYMSNGQGIIFHDTIDYRLGNSLNKYGHYRRYYHQFNLMPVIWKDNTLNVPLYMYDSLEMIARTLGRRFKRSRLTVRQ